MVEPELPPTGALERGPVAVTAAGSAPLGARSRAVLVSLLASYVGTALTIVKGILLLPLYLKLLGEAGYGAWLASGNVIGLLGLVDGGVSGVLLQRLAEAWGAGARRRFLEASAAAALFSGAIGATVLGGGLLLAPWVPVWIHAPEDSRARLTLAFTLAASAAASSLALNGLLAVSAAWQRAEIGAAARLCGQIAETMTIVGGLWSGWGVVALGSGALVGALAALSVALPWTALAWSGLQLPPPSLRLTELRSVLGATLPLSVSRVLLQVDANVEVTLVAVFVGPAAAAIYAITDRVLRVAMGFINPIAIAIPSAVAHLIGEQGRGATAAPLKELFAIWSLVMAAVLPTVLALNRDFTSLWIGSPNYGGLALNVAFFWSELLGGRELLLSSSLMAFGAIRASAGIGVAEVLVRLPLMYLALRVLGPLGLPAATAVVSLGAVAVYIHQTSRQIGLGVRGGWAVLGIGVAAVAVSFSLGVLEAAALPLALTWSTLVVKAAAVALVHLALATALCPAGGRALWARLSRRLLARRGAKAR